MRTESSRYGRRPTSARQDRGGRERLGQKDASLSASSRAAASRRRHLLGFEQRRRQSVDGVHCLQPEVRQYLTAYCHRRRPRRRWVRRCPLGRGTRRKETPVNPPWAPALLWCTSPSSKVAAVVVAPPVAHPQGGGHQRGRLAHGTCQPTIARKSRNAAD